MAVAASTQAKSASAAQSKPPQPVQHKSKTGLVIGAVVLGIIAVQIVVTYSLMRGHGPSDAGANHADAARAAPGHNTSDHESGHETGEEEIAEISLGEFSFSNTAAIQGIIMHVDFKLTALASSSTSSALESQISRSQERIREAVNKVVRGASYDELIDPNLGTLKRLIRDELNRMLGKNLVGEVVINDIRILQQ